jgi:uncharacterized protein YfaS (alpha-2-macroglobulin family)
VTKDKLKLEIKNSSANKLYATIISKGIPVAGDEKDASNGLELDVEYQLASNKEVIDLSSGMVQGQDLQIQISVHNTSGQSLENIALSHLIPTGWEIHNANYGTNDKYDHKDVRDDRIYTYFSLQDDEVKKFTILVNSAYRGHFYLPAISAEAMYKPSIQARKKGSWVDVL